MNNPMLSVITLNSDGLVHQFLVVLVVAVCMAIVWALGRWAIKVFAAPAIVNTVWNGLFLFVGAICLINFLMGCVGHPLIAW